MQITVYFINTREAAHCCEEQFTTIMLYTIQSYYQSTKQPKYNNIISRFLLTASCQIGVPRWEKNTAAVL
jgi:hypothetical protein